MDERTERHIANLRKQAQKARDLADAATRYADYLNNIAAKGEKRGKVAYAHNDVPAFALCLAAIDVADDGDFSLWRSNICDENRWDHEGYPVDEYGHRCGEQFADAPQERDGMDLAKERRMEREEF